MPLCLITYENKDNQSAKWFEEELKTDMTEAKKFLENKGFINCNGFYERKATNWLPNTRAFINPMKVSNYNNNTKKNQEE